jgi:predicted alpha-1,2-mannosidase
MHSALFTFFRTQLLGAFVLATSTSVLADSQELASFVNPMLGTKPCPTSHSGFSFDTGDVFPGAVSVHGMVQFSPDTPRNQAGGYWYPDTTIKSFSLTHFSGRGIPYEGDFGFMPVACPIAASTTFDFAPYRVPFSHSNEVTSAGYYKVTLDNGNVVELTCTPRTGMMQATFPANTSIGSFLLNIGNNVRALKNGEVHIVDGKELTGFATSTTSGNQPYTVYISAVFDQPITAAGTWNGPTLTPGRLDSVDATAGKVGAFVSFNTMTTKVIHATVGISYISIDNARLNRTTENPGHSFDEVKAAAKAAWNNSLKAIVINDPAASKDSLTVFYTELYHTLIHPNLFDDVNGQYMGFDNIVHKLPSGHHHYTHIPGWDEYRSHTALMALLFPEYCSDVAQSLVDDTAQNKGKVPRWVQQNSDSRGMIGDGGAVILANAYAFGARDFDAKAALDFMAKNASGANHYREGEAQFQSEGWVNDKGSITLEYCVANMALAQFAKSLGNDALYHTYATSAQNWKKMFDPQSKMLTARTATGNLNLDPKVWIEGSREQYTWLVPFNLRGLFDIMGGNEKVTARLDTYFGWNPATQTCEKINSPAFSPFHYAGNEPGESQPWSYLYAGAPWKTQKVVRDIQTQVFFNGPDGLPGNDDAGAISSWYVFSALGLYPMIPGVGGFVIGSPLFASATVTTGSGHVLQINGLHAAPGNPYVQSLELNGKPSTALWILVTTILNNPTTTLSFTLGAAPDTSRATASADAPPSFDAPHSPDKQ